VKPETMVLILIVAVVLIVAVLAVWSVMRRRRSQNLREKFGPEYDHTLEKEGDRRTAEATLKEREKRVTKLDVRALDQTERDRYHGEWTNIQAGFVDDPSKSVEAANQLITEVMIARGFPVADFEQRAADLSVMFPNFVSNYRNAQAIALKNKQNGTSTEELRQAMVYYHSMFEELLGSAEVKEVKEVEVKEKEAGNQ
jgi:hypothetical protein